MTRTTPRHSAQELFEATGETRQIFARDTRLEADSPLVRIELGTAASLRPDARAGHLLCPIPGCEDPRYTTRGGSRRDHFAHLKLVGAPHAPESYFHFTGKHVIGAWLRRTYPEARLVIDAEAVENRQVPDVLAEFPDGRRLAFEVQYAALTTDEWGRRQQGYAAQGITGIWILGHVPRYLRHPRGSWESDRYVRTPLAEALIASGVPLHWMNPDEGLIASRRHYTDPIYADYFDHDAQAAYKERLLDLAFDPLDGCRIEGTAFLTPTDIAEREAERRFAARLRLREEAARKAAEAEAAKAARKASLGAWIEQQKAQRAADYAKTLRPELVREIPEALEFIEVELPADKGIHLHPAAWHAQLWRRCIEGHVGEAFTYAKACGPLMREGNYPRAIHAAISGYLHHLRRNRVLAFHAEGYWIDSEIAVLGDSKHLLVGPQRDWRPW